MDFGAWYETTSLPAVPPPFLPVRTPHADQPRADAKYPVRTMEYISFENLSHAKSSTKGNWIPGTEEETACEQRPRDFKGGYCVPPSCRSFSLSITMPAPSRCPPPSPRLRFTLVSQLLFFDASSFLIAANRDVKTIRGPLARLGTRCSILFSLSQTLLLSPTVVLLPSLMCLWRKARCVLAHSI